MNLLRALAPFAATAALTTSLLAAPSIARAQAPRPPSPPSPASAPAVPAGLTVIESRNADETRDALMEALKRYPPSVGRVLKTDPSLMSNASYMSAYPVLTQFLQQHPDVMRNPTYYFGELDGLNYSTSRETPTQQAINAWRNIIEGFTFLLGFLSVVAGITWIIRSVIEHRRWSRLSRVQAEVHNKLIDRLASNDEMLAYIQSPAGAGFLKAGPIDIGTGAKSMHAPFSRILWAAQAGVVLLALGLGLRWVTVSAPNEVVEMLHFFGIIAQALGLGFIVSGGLTYLLSRRMGLIEPSATTTERGTPSRS